MTCSTVNKEIKANGWQLKIYKGKGYYYFMATGKTIYNVPSLYTMDLSAYTLEEIISHINSYV